MQYDQKAQGAKWKKFPKTSSKVIFFGSLFSLSLDGLTLRLERGLEGGSCGGGYAGYPGG